MKYENFEKVKELCGQIKSLINDRQNLEEVMNRRGFDIHATIRSAYSVNEISFNVSSKYEKELRVCCKTIWDSINAQLAKLEQELEAL